MFVVWVYQRYKQLQNTYNSLTTEISREAFHPLGSHLLNLTAGSSHVLTLFPSPSGCCWRAAPCRCQREAVLSPAQAAAGIPAYPLHMPLWDTIHHHRALAPTTQENYLQLEATEQIFSQVWAFFPRESCLNFFILLGRT